MSFIRHALRSCVLVSALLASVAILPSQPPASANDSHAALPEVRLRKLHLVRPDLIFYPLAYEVLC